MNKIAIYTNSARSSKNNVWLKKVLEDIYRNLWFIKCFKMCNCCIFYGHTFTYTPKNILNVLSSVSSVTQSCPTLCNPVNHSTAGLPVHHQLPEFTQTHMHQVGDAIQPSHPLLSPSPPAPNPSQHQSLFQWVNSSHEVAKVLEFQL